jgi:hypothetical protein
MKNLFKVYITLIVLLSAVYPVYAGTVLTWDASTGTLSGYRIYYGTSSGNYSGMEETGNVTQYSLSNLPLQEKTSYYFVVRAFNSAGESDPSNEVTYYCPDSTPPVPPQGLSRQVSGSSVVLSWSANTETDLAGYNVYQRTSTGIYGTPSSLGKVSTYTVSGLTAGNTYYFAVSALDNSSNESGNSSEVSATIPDSTIPTVAIASPTSSSTYATSTSSITLSGTASDNVGVTRVTWANTANGTSGIATGTTSWSISAISLAAGTNTITVTASDSAGNTANDILTVTYAPPDTAVPVIAIASPTSSSTYSTTTSTVTLSGTASDNVGVTRVTWANAANGTSGIATGTTSWSTSAISLIEGSNTLTVTASDSAGNKSSTILAVTYSVPKVVTTADTTKPVVTIKTPTANVSYSTRSSSLKLTGTATDNVGATKVTWANTANGTSGTATGTASWSVSKITLKIGTNVIIITASDAAGNSSTDTLSVTRRR